MKKTTQQQVSNPAELSSPTDDELRTIRKTVKAAVGCVISTAGRRKESFCGYEFELPTLLVLSSGRTGHISTKNFRVFWFNDGVKKKKLSYDELLEVFFYFVEKKMF